MGRPFPTRVTVAGAGALGTATALALARAGARVILTDPADPPSSASGIAAGMLAPAFEAALDPASRGQFALLRAARDLWPAFVADLPTVRLDRDGARFVGPADEASDALRKLHAAGAEAWADGEGVFSPEDWRLEPVAVLAAMRKRFEALGGAIVRASASTPAQGEALVVACGYGGLALAPELAVLSPIKGQLLRFEGAPREGPILRARDGYLVPTRQGAVVGATMQSGISDPSPDPALNAGLRALAVRLAPELAGTASTSKGGVRAATPDGLPLVGPSRAPGVWLSAGARRNGWLLAPLIAQTLVARMRGEEGGEAVALFDPRRFDP